MRVYIFYQPGLHQRLNSDRQTKQFCSLHCCQGVYSLLCHEICSRLLSAGDVYLTEKKKKNISHLSETSCIDWS